VAAKKKTMGRGLGSLLERRNSSASSPISSPATSPATSPASSPAASQTIERPPNQNPAVSIETANQKFEREATPADANPGGPSTSTEMKTAGVTTSAADASQPSDSSVTLDTGDKLRVLGIDQIKRGTYQPRRHFDPELLQELSESLSSEGLIQPILVRPDSHGSYELIAGERRWRAAQLTGFTEIPAIVRQLEDQAVASVALIENIQRKDLNPLEEAEALQRLSDEFGLSHKQIAESVGRSRSAVTNLMRLLDLHEEVKALIDVGDIDMGHARALLGAPINDQPTIARRIAQQGLTVRAVEKQIKALRSGAAPKASSATVTDPDIDRLEKHLSEKLGAKVSIRHKAKGSGKLEISYHSMDELDGILNHIK